MASCKLWVALLLQFVLFTVVICNVFLPFYYPVCDGLNATAAADAAAGEDDSIVGGVCQRYLASGPAVASSLVHLRVFFFVGVATGTVAAGAIGYAFDSRTAHTVFTRLVLLSTLLLSSRLGRIEGYPSLVLWFLLAASTMGLYTILFVFTVELVPKKSRLFVGLCLFGWQWSLARLYAFTLFVTIENWQQALFWNACVIVLVISFQHCAKLPRSGIVTKETVGDLLNNRLGVRYVACLVYLWFIHGYIYYGLAHGWAEISDDHIKSTVFVCLMDALATLLTYYFCKVWKQKRSVLAVLMLINAVICFVLAGCARLGVESAVDTISQVSSFLVTGSWNLLWLFTVEVFGNKVRYVATGFCSLFARASSLLGVLLIHYGNFYDFYAALTFGVLYVIGVIVVFLLPECDNVELIEETRH